MGFELAAAFALLFSLFSFGLTLYSVIELKAMQKSTHNIQYVPVEEPTGTEPTEDISQEKLSKIFETNAKPDPFEKDFDNVM